MSFMRCVAMAWILSSIFQVAFALVFIARSLASRTVSKNCWSTDVSQCFDLIDICLRSLPVLTQGSCILPVTSHVCSWAPWTIVGSCLSPANAIYGSRFSGRYSSRDLCVLILCHLASDHNLRLLLESSYDFLVLTYRSASPSNNSVPSHRSLYA